LDTNEPTPTSDEVVTPNKSLRIIKPPGMDLTGRTKKSQFRLC
jgi:hypothetical protein